jgi:hypothetical protein
MNELYYKKWQTFTKNVMRGFLLKMEAKHSIEAAVNRLHSDSLKDNNPCSHCYLNLKSQAYVTFGNISVLQQTIARNHIKFKLLLFM